MKSSTRQPRPLRPWGETIKMPQVEATTWGGELAERTNNPPAQRGHGDGAQSVHVVQVEQAPPELSPQFPPGHAAEVVAAASRVVQALHGFEPVPVYHDVVLGLTACGRFGSVS